MDYNEWAARWPQAAAELGILLGAIDHGHADNQTARSEGAIQALARRRIAAQGAMSWRNNVGATPAKCPHCKTPQQPVRYGLANDSAKLNKQIKSSDLILAIPRTITPDMVGTRIAQFGSVECKRPGWKYTGTEREVAQRKWLELVASLGGYACFSTGEIEL